MAWNNLGCVDLAQGMPMQARARFREALRINPEGKLARDNLKLVAAPERPVEIYREWEAFVRQLFRELCDGVVLADRGRRAGREAHVLALALATRGRALPVLLRRAPRLVLLVGLGSAGAMRLLRAGPVGVVAALGSGAAAYWLSREKVAALSARYAELLHRSESEYARLQGEWLRGALHRRERDAAIGALIDDFCKQIEAS